jgi:eukaryotic-like serine/threonine-protein kinase
MRCRECRTENSEGSRYCVKCATPLSVTTEGRDPEAPTLAFPPRPFELAPGAVFAGRYLVRGEVGRGGMGTIYRALDRETGEEVSIKLINPDIAADRKAVERFRNEVRIARRIVHKNVCRMIDLGRDGGIHYLTMEYVPGEDLKSLIRRAGRIDPAAAAGIARQICLGLAEAHRLGVIHRDLKPQNVMIEASGNVRILDFGLARSADTCGATTTGMILGTPGYISPEQIDGRDVDQRTDIYSLGVLLYEMLTGRLPFEGASALDVIHKQRSERAGDPRALEPAIPAALGRIVLKCLERNRESRYRTVEDVLGDLEAMAQAPGKRPAAAGPSAAEDRPRPVRPAARRMALAGLLIAAAVALVVLGGKPLYRRTPAGPAPGPIDLAVISFVNGTGIPAYDYLQEAIPDLLISSLERHKGFRVASREQIAGMIGRTELDIPAVIEPGPGLEIFKDNGIEAVVAGSFTKAGDMFETEARVLETGTGEVLASVRARGRGVDSIIGGQIEELGRQIARRTRWPF